MPSSGSSKRYAGETDRACPEVYTVAPTQPADSKPGQLEYRQVEQFFDEGFLLVEDFFTHEELQPVRDAIDLVVEEFVQWLFKHGKIPETYDQYGFEHRLILIEKAYPGSTVLIHKRGELKQAFRDLWTNERLLNMVEQLIGPDIAGHPVWNLRTKTPQNEATVVPWHQDNGYLSNEAYEVLQPAAWIPLVDANERNGCMEFIRGSHRKGRISRHTGCWASTHYIMAEEKDIESTLEVDVKKDTVLVPVSYGSLVLLNNMVVHRSLPNLSDGIRWSLDLRWQTPNKPCGFYGIKNATLFRSAKEPGHVIDWSTHDTSGYSETPTDEDFDSTIQGPWMLKWELTNHNKHTAKLSGHNPLSWH